MGDSFLETEGEEESDKGDDSGVIEAEYEVKDDGDGGSDALIQPVTDDLQEITKTYESFQRVKSELLDEESDLQTVSGRPFITKSGWRKIATAFNISIETQEEKRSIEGGVVQWRVKAEAIAPNGVSATGVGMAASNESNFMDYVADKGEKDPSETAGDVLLVDGSWRRLKDPKAVNEHDIFATAATRAKNRAISDLVGGGEVSAEELSADTFIS